MDETRIHVDWEHETITLPNNVTLHIRPVAPGDGYSHYDQQALLRAYLDDVLTYSEYLEVLEIPSRIV